MRIGNIGKVVQEFEFDDGVVKFGDIVEVVDRDSSEFGNIYIFKVISGMSEDETFELDDFSLGDVIEFDNEINGDNDTEQMRASIIAELSTLGDEYGMKTNDVIKFIKEHM